MKKQPEDWMEKMENMEMMVKQYIKLYKQTEKAIMMAKQSQFMKQIVFNVLLNVLLVQEKISVMNVVPHLIEALPLGVYVQKVIIMMEQIVNNVLSQVQFVIMKLNSYSVKMDIIQKVLIVYLVLSLVYTVQQIIHV